MAYLADVINSAVAALVNGKTPSNSTVPLFSTRDDATPTYVRNPSLFASTIDLTCISAYSTAFYGSSSFHFTAVSNWFSIRARHIGSSLVGTHIRYVKAGGAVVDVEIVDERVISGTDLVICLHGTSLAGQGIKPAKFLAADFQDYVGLGVGIQALYVTQRRELAIGDCLQIDPANAPATTYGHVFQIDYSGPWGLPVIAGDSSGAIGTVVGGDFILLAPFGFGMPMWPHAGGTTCSSYLTEILAAMASMGHANDLTTVSLAAYDAPQPPTVIPGYTGSFPMFRSRSKIRARSVKVGINASKANI